MRDSERNPFMLSAAVTLWAILLVLIVQELCR